MSYYMKQNVYLQSRRDFREMNEICAPVKIDDSRHFKGLVEGLLNYSLHFYKILDSPTFCDTLFRV